LTTAGQNEDHSDFGALVPSAQPAFLWRPRDCSIAWANPAGLSLWGAQSLLELASRRFDRSMPAVARLQRLLLVLALGASDRQTLVFWLPQGSKRLTCQCRKVHLSANDEGLLLQVVEQPNIRGPLANGPASHAEADLNGHMAFERVAAPGAWQMEAPVLAPQDAATLAEIARLIRERTMDGGGRRSDKREALAPESQPKELEPETGPFEAEFLGRLSHELRTPLNAVIGYGELLQAEQSGPLGSPKYRGYTVDLLEAARHCLSLVNDLFDMTRLAAAGGGLEFSDVDINESARVCLAILVPIASKAGVALTDNLGAGLPLAILDRRSLRQILLNLLANAIKFTPAGGSVSIGSSYETGVGLKVVVADTGRGMTTGSLNVARGLAPNNAEPGPGASGLGLPISRDLAAANGGTLAVESEPGRGTRVTLFVPMNRLLLR